ARRCRRAGLLQASDLQHLASARWSTEQALACRPGPTGLAAWRAHWRCGPRPRASAGFTTFEQTFPNEPTFPEPVGAQAHAAGCTTDGRAHHRLAAARAGRAGPGS